MRQAHNPGRMDSNVLVHLKEALGHHLEYVALQYTYTIQCNIVNDA